MRLLAKDPADLADGRYDVVVIAPSYEEGDNVLRLLQSVAVQEGIDAVRVAVLVVINSADDAPPEVRESNAETQALIEALWRGELPEDLADLEAQAAGAEEAGHYVRERIEAFRTAAGSRAKLLALDAWSDGHALPVCNVGIARHIGGTEGVRLAPDGVLAFTDADSWYRQGYLSALWEIYRRGADAATGPAEVVPGETMEEIAAADVRGAAYAVQRAQELILRVESGRGPDERTHDRFMSGANLTLRSSVYAEVGGFDPVAGAEDGLLSTKVLRAGRRIVQDERLTIVTPARISLRTHADHGYGQHLARAAAYEEDFGAYPVPPLAHRRLWTALVARLEAARALGADEAAWMERLRAFDAGEGVAPLQDAEIAELWRTYRLAPDVACVEDNDFLSLCCRAIAEARHPNVPLELALLEAEGWLVNREDEPDLPQRASAVLQAVADARPALRALEDFARGVCTAAATDDLPVELFAVAYGLPVDDIRAGQEEMVERTIDLHAAASAIMRGSRIDEMVRRCTAVDAALAGSPHEGVRPLVAAVSSAAEAVGRSVTHELAAYRILHRGQRIVPVALEDREPLHALLAAALEPHLAALRGVLFELAQVVSSLVRAQHALPAAVAAAAPDECDAFVRILREIDSAVVRAMSLPDDVANALARHSGPVPPETEPAGSML